MPNLIDHTFFIGNINLPNTNQPYVQDRVNGLITHHEPALLVDLLGYQLYKNFIAELAVLPTPATWATDLLNGKEYTYEGKLIKWMGLKTSDKQSIIANYVYYHYQREEATQSTAVGQSVTKAENAVRISPVDKQCSAWNEMVKWVFDLVRYLETNEVDYPLFKDHCINEQYFTTINYHNL